MTNKETLEAWKKLYAEIDKENWLFVGTINPEMVSLAIKALEEKPQGEYVDISKLRLMTVEECAGHTIDYAMGWKACVEWIKKGGAE